MTTPADLADYYAARALEYEDVYAKPERQSDLVRLRSAVVSFARGRSVLEVACGTGYWTAVMAGHAASVVATDIGIEVLEIARAKGLPRVTFVLSDAYALADVPGAFDAAFAGFWWSHVRREEIPRFLQALHARIGPRATIMLVDNRYVEGGSTPISRTDATGNTYQSRRLSNGKEYEVLKNFPTPRQVYESLSRSGASSIEVVELQYYWFATYVSGAA